VIGQHAPTSDVERLVQRIARLEERIADLQRSLVPLRPFTPVLSAVTTPPSLGTLGSVEGDYTVEGGRCRWAATIVFNGSSVSAGSGAYRVLLPVAPKASITFRHVGSGWWYLPALGFRQVELDASPGGAWARMICEAGEVTHAAPAAPTATAVLSVGGEYPIA
jgi:hypothetical protein